MSLEYKLWKEPEEYFNGLGFSECGEHEWKNNNGWILEFVGNTERPNCWRLDELNIDGHQIIFIDLYSQDELEFVLKRIIV